MTPASPAGTLVLSPQEKERIRAFLYGADWLKLSAIVEQMRPSANCTNAGSHGRDAFSNDRANARLGEMRGWDLHKTAIEFAVRTEAPKPLEVEPTFPDEGTLVIEPKLPSQ